MTLWRLSLAVTADGINLALTNPRDEGRLPKGNAVETVGQY
jgi:hypothetical protein